MSKYLIKILSICAFVIVLPLAILGTALCVTETKSYTLSLYVKGEDRDNAPTLLIDGEEKNQITVQKNTTVTITFASDAYNFTAWYEGTDVTYETDKFFSDERSVSFKLTSNLDLTAVVNVKTYNVTYTGIEYAFENPYQYKYGQELITKAELGNEAFKGWLFNGTTYTHATFEKSGPVTLRADLGNTVDVVYHFNNTTHAEKVFQEELAAHKFLDETSPLLEGLVPAGYYATWVDGSGKPVEEIVAGFEGKTLDLYLKNIAIVYNLKVTSPGKDVSTPTVDLTLTHNEEGKVVYSSNYASEVTRKGYAFVGLKYNDEAVYAPSNGDYVYNGTKLSDVIMANANSETHDIELTAVWKANYSNISIMFFAVYNRTNNTVTAKDGNTEVDFLSEFSIRLSFDDTLTGYDLNDNVYEAFLKIYGLTLTAQFEYRGAPVQLDKTYIQLFDSAQNRGSITVSDLTTMTFNDLIQDILLAFNKNGDQGKSFIESEALEVGFSYVNA